MKKSLLIIIAVPVLALVGVLVFIFSPKTIVLDNYIEIEVNGYNGYGSAKLITDTDAIFEMISDKADTQELLWGRLYKVVDVDLDKWNDLSNGDVITIELDVDESYFKSLGYKIKLKRNTYTVRDLPEPKTINPFKYLEISYEGYDPYARPVLTNTATDPFISSNLSFYTGAYEVSEGDEIKVCANFNEGLFRNNGYVVETSEKTYVATGVPQPKEIDPFDLLTVKYSGVDGKGEIHACVDKENDAYKSLYMHFSFDKTRGLKTGDVVTCSVSWSFDAERYGYKIVGDKEKKFTVPQLGKYATDLSLVSDEVRSELAEVALNKAKEYYQSADKSGYLYTSTSLFGKSYKLNTFEKFENIKITQYYGLKNSAENTFGFVMTVDLGGNADDSANKTAYFYVAFKDLVINADGRPAEGWEELASCHKNTYNSYDLLLKSRFRNSTYTINEY